ncbi:MAG: HigA family addiction module antidote protein, partial [Chloroflexi bacterium]|nr:HigA family addiction module antidote protein [Chloroflexota bacterium]
TQYRLAKDINVDPRRINEIVQGKRTISADTALRLSRYFGTSERFWMNLQARYDLEEQREQLGDRLDKEVKVLAGTRRLFAGQPGIEVAGDKMDWVDEIPK